MTLALHIIGPLRVSQEGGEDVWGAVLDKSNTGGGEDRELDTVFVDGPFGM